MLTILLRCLPVALLVVIASWRTSPPAARDTVLAIALPAVDSVDVALLKLEQLLRSNATTAELRQAYEQCREFWKHVEPFIGYVDPSYTSDHLNGAPLPRLDNKSQFPDVLPPQGFQVLDEAIYADTLDHEFARTTASTLRGSLRGAATIIGNASWSRRMLIELCRTAVFRITAMGITAFDRPASEPSHLDDTTALNTIAAVLHVVREGGTDNASDVHRALALVRGAGAALRAAPAFDELDRMDLIRTYLDPLYGILADIQQARGIEWSDEVSALPSHVDPRARSMFSVTTLNRFAASGLDQRQFSAARAELGRLLFFDPLLSETNERACASCHKPQLAFTDGMAKSMALGRDGTIDRNAPTLINAIYSTRFFYDVRAKRLADVVSHVATHEREFGTSLLSMLGRLRASDEYRVLFAQAFPNDGQQAVSVATIGLAMSAYLSTLTAMNTPVDRYLRGEDVRIADDVRRGFNLFHGRAACATCHFPPTYSGLVPPSFAETETEILGVPVRPDTANAVLDPDPGRSAGIVRENHAIYRHSFKTPTIRNAALTAPYMHNGAYTTLEQVVEFYDRGGGRGIGIPLEYQTLAADRLNFSKQDYADLIAFMKAMTDTVGTGQRPTRLPKAGSPALHARVIGGVY